MAKEKKTITKQDVEHVAKLARIELTEEEKDQFTSELGGIFEFIEQIQEVDTEGVEPTFQPAGLEGHNVLENITREDRIVPCDDREKLLNAAPAREGDFVKVKSVLN